MTPKVVLVPNFTQSNTSQNRWPHIILYNLLYNTIYLYYFEMFCNLSEVLCSLNHFFFTRKWYDNPNLKLVCFVCYFKIINTFLKNNVLHHRTSCPKYSKMAINLSRSSSVSSMDQKSKYCFDQ